MKGAIITGASSGIGRSIAIELAKKNYELLLVSRSEERLKNLKYELEKQFNSKVFYIVFDLYKDKNYERIVNTALEVLDDFQLLVNNAGVGIVKKTEELTMDDVEKLFWTNIISHIMLTKYALNIMKSQGYGKIVNIISLIAFYPMRKWQLYTATKMAQEGFFKSLKKELKGTNVHVINVYPGRTKTEFFKRANVKEDYPFMDSADYVARKVVKAIESKGNKEVFMHWWGWLLSKIHGFI